ncbi:MAG: hypothetical protein LBD23_07660 [Oscillospiraceae bacterium]|jgi:hypothetical protein|nr:hypothetical protein [Oscillospiraceae bacterium]
MQYYYSLLNEKNKKIYNSVFEGINDFDENIYTKPLAQKDLPLVFNSVIYDNPILFQTRAFRSINYPLRSQATISPIYNYDQDFTDQSTEVISEYLKLFDVVKDKSDIEKELFVHDHCLDNFKYDRQLNEHAFSVIGPVIFNTGVCEGISKFVKIALNYLGVDCIVVVGRGYNPSAGLRKSEPHMWNIVYINGKTYHLDVTFNLTQKGNINRYDYFNLPDNEIKKDHSYTGRVPICNTAGNDYYSLSLQAFPDLLQAEEYIKNELQDRKKSIIFKLTSTTRDSNMVDKVIDITKRQIQSIPSIFNANLLVDVRYNSKQNIFEIEIK